MLQLIYVILALYVISLIPKFSTQRCWNASLECVPRLLLSHGWLLRTMKLPSPILHTLSSLSPSSSPPPPPPLSLSLGGGGGGGGGGGASCSSFCLTTFPDAKDVKVGDVSQLAYAGVVYLRMINEQGVLW